MSDLGNIDIRVLDNRENRFDSFIDLFRSLIGDGYGKLEKDFFIIGTDVFLNFYRNNEEKLFTLIQQNSNRRGIKWNMFMINKEENE